MFSDIGNSVHGLLRFTRNDDNLECTQINFWQNKKGKWGAKVIEQIASDLETELRGFSDTSLKKMKIFYEVWEPLFLIGPLTTDQLE